MKRLTAKAVIAAVVAALLVPGLAFAQDASAAGVADTQVARASDVAASAEQASCALLKADGWLYRADGKGKALEGGRTWSSSAELAKVEQLFVAADVPALAYDAASGRDFSHPAVKLATGGATRKVHVSLGSGDGSQPALTGLDTLTFKTGKAGSSACAAIGHRAFMGSALRRVDNFDKTAVAEIGSRAFAGCDKLEQLVVPETCTAIGSRAFIGCSALAEITLRSPEAVTLSGKAAFFGTPLANPFSDVEGIRVPAATLGLYTRSSGQGDAWLRYRPHIAAMPNLSAALVKVESAEYTGKPLEPQASVRYAGEDLQEGADFSVAYSGNTNAGVGKFSVSGIGKFEGAQAGSFGILKASDSMVAEASDTAVDYYRVYLEDTEVEGAIKVKGAGGKLSYKLVDGSADGRISIGKKSGVITVSKSTPEGSYPVKVKVKSSGDANHKPDSATVAFALNVSRENTLPSVYKFMAIAQREYDEGVADGSLHHGDSKYWKTFVNKYQSWCSEFVGWCLMEAGLERGVTMPKNASYAKAYWNFYKDRPDIATIHENGDGYEPQPGDIVLQVKSGNRFWHTEMITWSDGYNYGGISGGNHVGPTERSLGNREYRYFITINWDEIAKQG